jgi:hypothetical protein
MPWRVFLGEGTGPFRGPFFEEIMSIFKQFGTDKKLEQEGVLVEYPANEDGSIPTFRLARMCRSNKRYVKAVEVATRPHKRAIELGTIKPEVAEEIFLDVFVGAILLGWENILNEKGEDVKFSKDEAKRIMKMLPDLYDDLQEKSRNMSTFLEAEMEQEEKN